MTAKGARAPYAYGPKMPVPESLRSVCRRYTAEALRVGDATYLALTEEGGTVIAPTLDRVRDRIETLRADRKREPTYAERRDWAAEDKGDLEREGG